MHEVLRPDADEHVLLVRGEPGIGKTALLDRFVDDQDPTLRIVRTTGVASESELGHAGLHRLLGPLLTRADAIPEERRRALRCAFGIVDGPAPDALSVVHAALALLEDAARASGLLCVIDDVHRLDPESRRVLTLVARRLPPKVAVLVAGAPLAGLGLSNELVVGGLDHRSAIELLDDQIVPHLDRRLARRVAVESSGSPLALLEFAAADPGELQRFRAEHRPLPVGEQVTRRYAARLAGLPDATQQLLLVLAADQRVDRPTLKQVAVALDSDLETLVAARNAGLVTWHAGDLVFAHPLVRAACYTRATPAERRRAHRLLADVLDPSVDLERRARHLAASSPAPDAAIAAELVRAAERAGRRGAAATRVDLLDAAAELTPEGELRHRRLLHTASAASVIGDPVRMEAALSRLGAASLDDRLLAEVGRLEAFTPAVDGHHGLTPGRLARVAAALGARDRPRARYVALEALCALQRTGGRAVDLTQPDLVALVRSLPPEPGEGSSAVDLLLDGYTAAAELGWPAGIPLLADAVRSWPDGRPESSELPRLHRDMGPVIWACVIRWDHLGLERVLGAEIAAAGRTGATAAHLSAMVHRVLLETIRGRRGAAEDVVERIADLGHLADGDLRCHQLARCIVEWWSGIDTPGETAPRAAARWGGADILLDADARHVRSLGVAVAANAARRHSAAAAAARPVAAELSSYLGSMALAELAEALAAAGESGEFATVLGELTTRARASGTPVALGVLARTTALGSADPQGWFQRSTELLTGSGAAHDLARAHLLFGEHLRRRRRRAESRAHLRVAEQLFAEMGATGFAERASRELAATGERARPRSVESGRVLTPQEEQVARLVREGLTNREIAARLRLSPSTVDSHLRKVFQKLGVTSRRALVARPIDAGRGSAEPQTSDVQGVM